MKKTNKSNHERRFKIGTKVEIKPSLQRNDRKSADSPCC